jgi:hypothetical protein
VHKQQDKEVPNKAASAGSKTDGKLTFFLIAHISTPSMIQLGYRGPCHLISLQDGKHTWLCLGDVL